MKPYSDYVSVFKALSDDTRLQIINMLSGGEMCACKILERFNITQPTLSYHMKTLTDCGLVTGVRSGAWMRYSLNTDQIEALKLLIERLTSGKNEPMCKGA